jgi:hypothetical protein
MPTSTRLDQSSKKGRTKPTSKQLVNRPGKPRWDKVGRKLWWGNKVIKEFLRPSVCQELVLDAFEELGWPECIDDPLPISKEINPKRRLHDTIKRLIGHHIFQAISFHGNGNGQGIAWRRLAK